jgi:hypothetical protein
MVGNPDIGTVSGIVFPPAVSGQFIFILFIAAVQVAGGTVPGVTHDIGSFAVPLIEIIGIG